MATKEFKARLINKIDTYENWNTNNPVLLKGEIAIVDVPASTDVVQQEPAVLMKIGDGTKQFNDLPWISAKSADVYSWALSPTKPTYQASEIEELDTHISEAVQESNTYTDNQIAAKIGAVYKPVGSVKFSELPLELTKAELGNVYNVTDAFEADARFVTVEVGENYPAGTNVAVIEENESYYFDALSGVIDLSNYYTKTETDQQITTKIGSLDKADSAVENQFVTAVSQTDGVISVTRAAITEAAIPTLSQSKISGLETALSAKIDASAVSRIGKTGNINDATQAEGDYLIINCGTSSDVI